VSGQAGGKGAADMARQGDPENDMTQVIVFFNYVAAKTQCEPDARHHCDTNP
jgi:hypothetical protein